MTAPADEQRVVNVRAQHVQLASTAADACRRLRSDLDQLHAIAQSARATAPAVVAGLEENVERQLRRGLLALEQLQQMRQAAPD